MDTTEDKMNIVKNKDYKERYEINGKIYEFGIVSIAASRLINGIINEQLRLNPNKSETMINDMRTEFLVCETVTIIDNGNPVKITPAFFKSITLPEYNEIVGTLNDVNTIKKKSLTSSTPDSPEVTGS